MFLEHAQAPNQRTSVCPPSMRGLGCFWVFLRNFPDWVLSEGFNFGLLEAGFGGSPVRSPLWDGLSLLLLQSWSLIWRLRTPFLMGSGSWWRVPGSCDPGPDQGKAAHPQEEATSNVAEGAWKSPPTN